MSSSLLIYAGRCSVLVGFVIQGEKQLFLHEVALKACNKRGRAYLLGPVPAVEGAEETAPG